MDTFSNLLVYIFNPYPGKTFSYYIVLTVITVLTAGLAVFIKFYIRKNKEDKALRRLFKKYPTRLGYFAVILAAYLFFRYYSVPFLSTRILLYIIVAVFAYLVYLLANTYIKKYPLEKKNQQEIMAKNKYLPGKKKRK